MIVGGSVLPGRGSSIARSRAFSFSVQREYQRTSGMVRAGRVRGSWWMNAWLRYEIGDTFRGSFGMIDFFLVVSLITMLIGGKDVGTAIGFLCEKRNDVFGHEPPCC